LSVCKMVKSTKVKIAFHLIIHGIRRAISSPSYRRWCRARA
jgi:hypothetical protein